MISLKTAEKLLDFGARIGQGRRAEEQLEGAVAIHNILTRHRIAYLADEVGMGKTYVALGALALFRHFKRKLRVLVISPRENIQRKWMKEMGNFVDHNVRVRDGRVKGKDGKPARPLVACSNLLEFVREVDAQPDRDFFLRLSSFSLAAAGSGGVDPNAAIDLRTFLHEKLPRLPNDTFDLRNKQAFKDNIARAICCVLPRFDLVIVDEAHNLKHGFKEDVAARNRVLALALGRPNSGTDLARFPEYGPRAGRILFLSATPVEDSYLQLWNQLDVFGRGEAYKDLANRDADEDELKTTIGEFLIRRVTAISVGHVEYTKNMYRREWRHGGVLIHDEPICVQDAKQRLIVALVQKKVSELLGHEKFNKSFQIGMLASFESFLETARLKQSGDEDHNFDGSEQPKDLLEREGIDVATVNDLSRSYRQKFGTEMPHPKMDEVVEALSGTWRNGRKALVFVRRVASVKELKRKLDDKYDEWLLKRLKNELPANVRSRLEQLFEQYKYERNRSYRTQNSKLETSSGTTNTEGTDHGGTDTFFAWFFRGRGPDGVVSGANVQQRFIKPGTIYSTFFEDNYVAHLLECDTSVVTQRLAAALDLVEAQLRHQLRDRSKRFLSPTRIPERADRFASVQAAAVEMLKDSFGPWKDQAHTIWKERFEALLLDTHAPDAPEIENWLEVPTFFSQLRGYKELRERIWPQSSHAVAAHAFRERELRRYLLASAARLGHAFIDLYVMTIQRLGSLELGTRDQHEGDGGKRTGDHIDTYLGILEQQMNTLPVERDWCAFDELAAVGENFELLLDVNEPDARNKPLGEIARAFGQLLGHQQPVGGMSGQLNQTLVRQFRMPGYPMVLVTTDLLQEGEDLHTFCSDVYHYGIAWTPSSMEQRIGRIDRVRSQTERRLDGLRTLPVSGVDKLQVFFPHLQDSVEVLQVDRVLARMNEFLRLMHNGLIMPADKKRSIDTETEMIRGSLLVETVSGPLKTAFPVRPKHIAADDLPWAVEAPDANGASRGR